MKKLTSLLVILLLATFAMAQTTIELRSDNGNYGSTGNWCSSWTSTTSPVATISVSANNMAVGYTTDNGFKMAVGSSSPSTWALSVQGYYIVSYSFNFKLAEENTEVTVKAGKQEIKATAENQTLEVKNVNTARATFQLSGSNKAIIVTGLTLKVKEYAKLDALEDGAVYLIHNRYESNKVLNASAADDVNVVAQVTDDLKQQWYVKKDGDYYTLRNLSTGTYLSSNGWSLSATAGDNHNKFQLSAAGDGSAYNAIRSVANANNDNAYMHHSSGDGVTSWSNGSSSGSHWAFLKQDYTEPEIEAMLDAFITEDDIKPALQAIFRDGGCTTLTDGYKDITEEALESDNNYNALPFTLKKMVKKVRFGNWAEDNAVSGKQGWDSEYAKKFRVQMYEPYSIESEITSYLRINAHSNMDNPTGIYANAGDVIYIMVDATEIPTGTELWVAHQTGFGATQYYNNEAYTRLQPGLNIVRYTADASCLWINYVVHTYNENGSTLAEKFPRKVTDFAPLKINIAGGHINGFYNAIGDYRATATSTPNLWGDVDNDADWDYYKERAPLNGTDAPNRDFPLLGHRQTLLFPLGRQANDGGGINDGLLYHLENITVLDAPSCYGGSGKTFGTYAAQYPGMGLSAAEGKINIMIEAWDRIMYSQLATMGVVSEATMAKMNDLYPRWTKEGSAAEIYNYGQATVAGETKTYKDFCQGLDYSEYFNHHGCGVGAPDGYMSGGWRVCNYHYETMGSIIGGICTQGGSVWGPAHEIGHQHQLVYNLNGQTEVTNNLFANIAMWYMGLETSRYNSDEGSLERVLTAFNTEGNDLYTNNIWAITHLYYRLWLYYHLAGNNTQFWPRLFELCRREPIENGAQISGETSFMRFYKHACDAAGEDLTEFFRAHGYLEVMEDRLVGDYSNATYNVTQEQIDAAIASVKAKNYPQNLAVLFVNDGTSNTTVQHDGETPRKLFDTNPTAEFGGVNDFIAGTTDVTAAYTATYNPDGTITMSGGAGGVGFVVLNEKGEIVSFSNKATFALGNEAKEALLAGKATIASVDGTSATTKAQIDLAVTNREILAQLIAEVQPMVEKVDDTYTKVGYYNATMLAGLVAAYNTAKEVYENGAGYESAYELLYTEYVKVKDNPDIKIPFDPKLTYIITNYAYTSETMWVNSSLTVRSEGGVDKTSEAARWQFKETATEGVYQIYNTSGYYCPAVRQSSSMTATEAAAADALYTLEEVKDGVWAICLSPAASHRNFHSSWSNVVGWETGADASRWYLTAVEKNETITDLSALQVLMAKTASLVDEVATIGYTKGEAVALQTTQEGSDYYISCNASEDSEGSIEYLVDGVKRDNNNYFHTEWSSEPTSGSHYLVVNMGNGNGLTRFAFGHTTRSGAQSDFPKAIDVYGSNDGSNYKLIGSVDKLPQTAGTDWEYTGAMVAPAYQYLRFNVHANRGYWHMAEFDIYPIASFAATVKDFYASNSEITAALVEAAHGAYMSAVSLGENPSLADITAKKYALQVAYDALKEKYDAIVDARKQALNTLVAETEVLINEVAENLVFDNPTKLKLTTANLFCNDPHRSENNDGCADDYVEKLTDEDDATYLHTDYNGSNDAGSTPHYLRVDLGENHNSVAAFMFNYTTRNNGNNCPTTIDVEGSNEPDNDGSYTTLKTLTAAADGLPYTQSGAASFESKVILNSAHYRYIRFKVTGVEGGTSPTFFVLSEFGFSTVSNNIKVKESYSEFVTTDLLLSTHLAKEASATMAATDLDVTIEMLDAQIAALTAAKNALQTAMESCSVTKDALQALYNEAEPYYRTALELYNKMADANGRVNTDYSPSALTNAQLAAAKTALDELAAALAAAKDAIDATTIAQADVNKAEEALLAAYNALVAPYEALLAVEDANKATAINKSKLAALIEEMATLLTNLSVEGTSAGDIALQATEAAREFYISAKATGDGSVANLVDKYADGTENTDSYYGSAWWGSIEAFSQYVEVDLGLATTIDKLLFDYTTRNSDHTTERPTAIKIFGSNNKVDYTEIATITDGMPVGQCERWAMSTPLELGARYRYIRFAAKGGVNDQGAEVNSFHMSDFNLYSVAPRVLSDYYASAGIDFNAMYLALEAASDANNRHYLTQEQYEAVLNKLAGYKTSLEEILADDTDKTELEELIAATNTLVESVATVKAYQSALPLQCDYATAPYYIYCNAPGLTNNYGGDNAGVEALIDLVDGEPDRATYLHTTYDGNDYADELDHYLRVDAGEGNALLAFKFSYVARVGYGNNAPKVMLIEGSNDLQSFEKITTLSNLPTRGTPEYESGIITNGKAYRYIRFMVKETEADNTHPFFSMSHFAMTSCLDATMNEEYALNLSPALVANAREEMQQADVVVNSYASEEAYNTAVADLRVAKEAIEAAMLLKDLPVKLTTDVANPVLYKIYITRSNNTVLQYDGGADATKQVAVADNAFGNKYQAWYFMKGSVDADNDDILIFPYWNNDAANTTLRLGSNDFGDGAGKVSAVDGSDESYKTNWYITTTDGTKDYCFNIRPEGKTTYFSNHGGVANKMGFWNSDNAPGDDGSNFKFVLDETDYNLPDSYFALANKHAECGGTKVAGTAIGCYPVELVEPYNTAYNAAAALIAAAAATADEYSAALTTLTNTHNALERNMPVEGGFYRIRSASTKDYCAGALVYVNDENGMQFAKDYDENSSRAIWYITPVEEGGGYHISSLHTGGYAPAQADYTMATLTSEPVTYTIDIFNDETGELKLIASKQMHAQSADNEIVGWNEGNPAGTASAWYIEEVDVKTSVQQSISLNTAKGDANSYSTLYSAYPVTLPDGVNASIITARDAQSGTLTMEAITDNDNRVVPAYTAVILTSTCDAASTASTPSAVNYAGDDAAVAVSANGNLLRGTLTTEYIDCTADDATLYSLGRKNNRVAMYKAYKNYKKNDDGTYRKLEDSSSNEGGYVKLGANKAYLLLSGANSSNVSMFSFWFGGGTTDIENVATDGTSLLDGTIYDLQGRKLERVSAPGLYIVNGKKVYVSEVE